MKLDEGDIEAIRHAVREVLGEAGIFSKLEPLEVAVVPHRRMWWTRQQCCELKGISLETVSRTGAGGESPRD